jgi:hypothetical protein
MCVASRKHSSRPLKFGLICVNVCEPVICFGRANADQVWSLSLPPGPLTKTWVLVPTSVVLQRLHDEVPTDHFTLGWLMHSLDKRSFSLLAAAIGLTVAAMAVWEMLAGAKWIIDLWY